MFPILCFHSVCQRDGQGTRYSNVTASLLPQPKLLAEAIITFRLFILLYDGEFRQSVLSKNMFSITYGFVASF
jgi:hypothetical protein